MGERESVRKLKPRRWKPAEIKARLECVYDLFRSDYDSLRDQGQFMVDSRITSKLAVSKFVSLKDVDYSNVASDGGEGSEVIAVIRVFDYSHIPAH